MGLVGKKSVWGAGIREVSSGLFQFSQNLDSRGTGERGFYLCRVPHGDSKAGCRPGAPPHGWESRIVEGGGEERGGKERGRGVTSTPSGQAKESGLYCMSICEGSQFANEMEAVISVRGREGIGAS